jgi:hypothetical protein
VNESLFDGREKGVERDLVLGEMENAMRHQH